MRATCWRRSIRALPGLDRSDTRPILNAIRLSSSTPRPISPATPHWGRRAGPLRNCSKPRRRKSGQLLAAIKADQALIDSAKVELSYTRLTSPIDGVVGIRQIDVGNIISPSTANGLVVVTQLDPISLIFTLPETVLPQIQQQQQKTKNPARGSRLQPG